MSTVRRLWTTSNGLVMRSGAVGEVSWPSDIPGLRVDTWVQSGSEITHNYDSLIAKVMVHKGSREEAVAAMKAALAATRVKGIPTNVQLMEAVLGHAPFVEGVYTTHVLDGMTMEPVYAEARSASEYTCSWYRV